MKNLILTLIIIFALSGFVQAQTMYIHKIGGEVISMPLNSIEKITYTGGEANTVSDFEGNVYKVVQIGTQWWMAENLRSTKYADGTSIEGVYDFNNNPSLTTTFGKYYTWDATMRGASATENNPSRVQGVCPTGFHLPSNDEWKVLADYVKSHYRVSDGAAGLKLKESGITYWNTNNGTNEAGFSARGTGRIEVGTSNPSKEMKEKANFWSSSHIANNPVHARRFSVFNNGLVKTGDALAKRNAISVRCLKD